MLLRTGLPLLALWALLTATVRAEDASAEMAVGSIELSSAGPLAFGPDGILLASDPIAATIYAIATDDVSGDPSNLELQVDDVRGKIASLVGSPTEDIQINDLAVNPKSGNVYLAVTRGSGNDAMALLMVISPKGEIREFPLQNVKYSKAQLPNPPASEEGRRGDPRMLTITDIAYVDGRVFIAGLSSEEFASKLRAIRFPFASADAGASVEIFHGAHGRIETRSPIMTFAPYTIGNEEHVVAAYTCTPLVTFRVADLQPGSKVRGRTVAELGNRNRPLDMFVYQKDGKDYILMANSSRGVMKITTEPIDRIDGITQHVPDGNTAGLPYDTIEELQGVLQLDRLNDKSAVALVRSDDGSENLRTIALP